MFILNIKKKDTVIYCLNIICFKCKYTIKLHTYYKDILQHNNAKQNAKTKMLILDKKTKNISWDKKDTFVLIGHPFFILS